MKGGTPTDVFIQGLMRETGKSISDADRNRIQGIVGMSDGSPSMRIRDQLVRSLQGTGQSISDSDMRRIRAMLGRQKPKGMDEGGKVKKAKKYKGPLPKPKPTKVERLLNKRVKGEKGPYIPKIGDLNEMGPMIIDNKTGKQVKRLNKGGAAVPSEFKGFSKLPEAVQVKMDPVAAKKYNGGGEVRGMGKAYMGSSRKAKIR